MARTYRRIERAEDLPPAGPVNDRAREGYVLDFKAQVDPAKPWRHARNIALFANWHGGVLLAGAEEQSGTLGFPGLARTFASKVVASYEQAAQTMCSPTPHLEPFIIGLREPPGRVVVAVNVDPSLDLIAARGEGHDHNGNEIATDWWRFPIRSANSHTVDIKPAELAMYMDRRARRVVLLTSTIGPKEEVGLWFQPVRGQQSYTGTHFDGPPSAVLTAALLIEVDATRSRIMLELLGARKMIAVPFSDVEEVWPSHNENGGNRWAIRISGRIEQTNYVPLARP